MGTRTPHARRRPGSEAPPPARGRRVHATVEGPCFSQCAGSEANRSRQRGLQNQYVLPACSCDPPRAVAGSTFIPQTGSVSSRTEPASEGDLRDAVAHASTSIAVSREPPEHLEKLVHLPLLLGGVAAADGLGDAVLDVVAEHRLLHTSQRRPGRADLREDVDAVTLLLDHADEPAELALDPAEPVELARVPGVPVLGRPLSARSDPARVGAAQAVPYPSMVSTSSAAVRRPMRIRRPPGLGCCTFLTEREMGTLLARNADVLVTMDGARRELRGAGLYRVEGFIRQVGPTAGAADDGDVVLDLRGQIVLPGLVNAHHHLNQTLTAPSPPPRTRRSSSG